MRRRIWMKGVIIGIIFLFFGVSCVPLVPIVSADDTWEVRVDFYESGGSFDYVIFGEKPDAHDGPPRDSYDVVKPPAPIPPYVRVWLNDNLPTPYDLLWKDYRQYPSISKVWNITVQWMPSGSPSPTMITVSWSTVAVNESEYLFVTLCTDTGTPLQNMRMNSSYSFSCPPYVPQSFTIMCSGAINQPPNVPSNPLPLNSATNIPINTQVSWTGGDPNPGDTVTYDVYFGMTNPPSCVVNNQSATLYNPGGLAYSTLYFWRIVAWDTTGASSIGPLWSFMTQAQNEYTLAVMSVGSGSVARLPDQVTYHYGDVVQLTASANPGWVFSYWSGDLSGSSNPTSVTIDGNKSVTATFTQNEFTLMVTTVGSGLVDKDPDQVTYHYGDTVMLTATAAPGWMFSQWSGDLTGSMNVTSIMIDGNKTVTATFIETPVNNPPYTPSDPVPANSTFDIPISVQLSWVGGDPDEGDSVTYDVFFGVSNPPGKMVSNQSGTTYIPIGLLFNMQYFWKIVTWDTHGASTDGPVWSFSTASSGVMWWNLDWLYRKEITIDHTQVSVDLVNFPVLIDLVADADLAAHAQSSGNDIIFTDAQGNKLNHEIELYDSNTGRLAAWVNVTSLSSITNTIVYLYYGNSFCGNQQNPQGTWNADFLMVHHLSESGILYDSTAHGLNAVNYGTTIDVNGKIDSCRYFDSTSDHLSFGTAPVLNPGLSSWTISMWTKMAYTNNVNLLQKYANDAGFFLKMYDTNYFYVGDGTHGVFRYWDTTWSDNQWHLITMVINRNTNRIDLYLDGALHNGWGGGNIAGFGSITTPTGFRIVGGTDGRYDELSISTTVRDMYWIQTCYNNQNNPSGFYSIGVQEYSDHQRPILSGENPVDHAVNVEINLSSLSVLIQDPAGDPLDWMITTSPNVGSASGSNEVNGTKSCVITTLMYSTTYRWYVNATNGYRWTNTTYTFTTKAGPSSWWDAAWMYRKEITIDHTKITTNLMNFTVLVSIAADADFSAHAQADGDDFVFTDFLGTKLNHEIEVYISSTGHLVAWVNIPLLSSTSDTNIYLYYGNSAASNQQNKQATWNRDYLMVQHMNDTGNIIDSTVNHLNGTNYGTTADTGKIGGCRYFDSTSDRVSFGTAPILNPGLSSWTISMWTKMAYTNNVNLLQKYANDAGFFLKMYDTNYFYVGDGTHGVFRYWDTTWSDNQWHLITMVINRNTNRIDLYLDGALHNGWGGGNIAGFGSITTPTGFRIVGGTDGRYDELSISTTVRDMYWIQTCYNNQDDPTGFYSLGNEES